MSQSTPPLIQHDTTDNTAGVDHEHGQDHSTLSQVRTRTLRQKQQSRFAPKESGSLISVGEAESIIVDENTSETLDHPATTDLDNTPVQPSARRGRPKKTNKVGVTTNEADMIEELGLKDHMENLNITKEKETPLKKNRKADLKSRIEGGSTSRVSRYSTRRVVEQQSLDVQSLEQVTSDSSALSSLPPPPPSPSPGTSSATPLSNPSQPQQELSSAQTHGQQKDMSLSTDSQSTLDQQDDSISQQQLSHDDTHAVLSDTVINGNINGEQSQGQEDTEKQTGGKADEQDPHQPTSGDLATDQQPSSDLLDESLQKVHYFEPMALRTRRAPKRYMEPSPSPSWASPSPEPQPRTASQRPPDGKSLKRRAPVSRSPSPEKYVMASVAKMYMSHKKQRQESENRPEEAQIKIEDINDNEYELGGDGTVLLPYRPISRLPWQSKNRFGNEVWCDDDSDSTGYSEGEGIESKADSDAEMEYDDERDLDPELHYLMTRDEYEVFPFGQSIGPEEDDILETAYIERQKYAVPIDDNYLLYVAILAGIKVSLVEKWFRWRNELRKKKFNPNLKKQRRVEPHPKTDGNRTLKTLKTGEVVPTKVQVNNELFGSGDKKIKERGEFKLLTRRFIPKERQHIQLHRCKTSENQCTHCVKRQGGLSCQFTGFRLFEETSEKKLRLKKQSLFSSTCIFGPDFVTYTGKDKEYDFSQVLKDSDKQASKYIVQALSEMLKPVLVRELNHIKDMEEPGVDEYVYRPSDDRQRCDNCLATIMSGHFFCAVCAYGMCLECAYHMPRTFCTYKRVHQPEQFIRAGRWSKKFVQSVLAKMKSQPISTVLTLPPTVGENTNSGLGKDRGREEKIKKDAVDQFVRTRAPPTPKAKKHTGSMKPLEAHHFKLDQVDNAQFRQVWKQREVVLVSGLEKKFKKGTWTPQSILENQEADDKAFLGNVKEPSTTMMKLADFFTGYYYEPAASSFVARMEEYPRGSFKDVFPSLNDTLLEALPLRDYTHPFGKLNLNQCIPTDMMGTELTPKLYIAQGFGSKNKQNEGTFPLLCEMADSLVLCVHALDEDCQGEESDPSAIVAVWDIFQFEDREKIRKIVSASEGSQKRPFVPTRDPIYGKNTYLTTKQQEDLWQKYGVRSYRIEQKLGEAILIPAGCLKQGRYLRNSIHVRTDFVSPEQMPWTLAIVAERQEISMQAKMQRKQLTPPDILQAKNLLFFGWLAHYQEGTDYEEVGM